MNKDYPWKKKTTMEKDMDNNIQNGVKAQHSSHGRPPKISQNQPCTKITSHLPKKGSHGPQKYAITQTLIIKIVHGKTPMSPTWTKVETSNWCKKWGSHHSLLNRKDLDWTLKNYAWAFYSKVFTMLLELLLYPTKHPTTTHMPIELCLSCTIALLMFRDGNSMVAIARKNLGVGKVEGHK